MDNQELQSIIEAFLFLSEEPLTTAQIKNLLTEKDSEKESSKDENKKESENSSNQEDGKNEAENLDNQEENKTESVSEEEHQEEDDVSKQLYEEQEKLNQEISIGEIKTCLSQIMEDYQSNPAKGFELVNVAKGYQFRTKVHLIPYLKKLYRMPKARLSKPSLETLSIIAYQQPIPRSKVEDVRGVDSGGVIKNLLERNLVRVIGRSEEPGQPLLYGTTKFFLECFNLNTLSDLPTLRDLEELTGESSPKDRENMDQPFSIEEGETKSVSFEDDSGEIIEELDKSLEELDHIEKEIFKAENPDAEENQEENNVVEIKSKKDNIDEDEEEIEYVEDEFDEEDEDEFDEDDDFDEDEEEEIA